MADLRAWLLERIEEDERGECTTTDYSGCHDCGITACRRLESARATSRAHADCDTHPMGPARVLADCAAKRQLVSLFTTPRNGAYDRWVGDQVLRVLALPYADRPRVPRRMATVKLHRSACISTAHAYSPIA
jgi:hypothetical protein